MENWNRANKAILAKKLSDYSPEEFSKEMYERVAAIEQLASTHIGWYTHKNPYGCWICDLVLLAWRMQTALDSYLMPLVETSSEMPSSSNSTVLAQSSSEVEIVKKEIENP